jgi:hypothetical protein
MKPTLLLADREAILREEYAGKMSGAFRGGSCATLNDETPEARATVYKLLAVHRTNHAAKIEERPTRAFANRS